MTEDEMSAGRTDDGAATTAQPEKALLAGLPQIVTLVGGLGGLLAFVYAIGGAVMWLRFNNAGFAADRAVALMPKADLLVIGLRVMIIPAIAAALVLMALTSIRLRRQREYDRLGEELHQLSGRNEAERIAEIERRRARLAGRPRPMNALPDRMRAPVTAALAAVALVLAVVVPFSLGAFAWPVVVVGLVTYWLRLRSGSPIGGPRRFPVMRIAVAGLVGAAIISVARQTQPPDRLPSVQVFVTQAPGLAAALGLAVADPRTPVVLNGTLIADSGEAVSVGDPSTGKIITVDRSHVSSVIVGPPLDVRSPPGSLLSWVMRGLFGGDTEWAVTPLEMWCTHLRYSWSLHNLVHFCGGRPSVAPLPLRVDLKNRLRPVAAAGGNRRGVSVNCPQDAPTATCTGFLALRFPPLSAQDAGALLTGQTPAVGFAIARGHTATVQFTLDPSDVRSLCAARPSSVQAVLALDALGTASIGEQSLTLTWPPRPRPRRGAKQRRSHRLRSPCSASAGDGGKPSGGSGPSGPSSSPTPSTGSTPPAGSGTSTPAGTASATSTPTGEATPSPTPIPTPVSSGPTPAPLPTPIPIRTATPAAP